MIRLSIFLAFASVGQTGTATVKSIGDASEQSQSGLSLAQLMAPRDLLVSVKMREFDRNFAPALLLNDDLKFLESEFPGSLAAMAAGARPLVEEQNNRLVDQLHRVLAQFFLTEFSASELAELMAFYRSPGAQNMTEVAARSLDTSAGYRSMIESEDGKVSQTVLDTQRAQAVTRTEEKMTDADKGVLLAFAKTPVFEKLQAVRPRIREIIASTFNAPDAAYEKRMDEAVDQALETHIASIGRKESR